MGNESDNQQPSKPERPKDIQAQPAKKKSDNFSKRGEKKGSPRPPRKKD